MNERRREGLDEDEAVERGQEILDRLTPERPADPARELRNKVRRDLDYVRGLARRLEDELYQLRRQQEPCPDCAYDASMFAALEQAKADKRLAAQILIEEIGAGGPEPLKETAIRAAATIRELRKELKP